MNSKAKVIAMCAIAVGLNVVLGEAVSMLRIPLLFLDTMGTIFIAANFGMGYGILTGVTTNLLMAHQFDWPCLAVLPDQERMSSSWHCERLVRK